MLGMEAISNALAANAPRPTVLSMEIGASLTRQALEEMQTQAVSVLDAVPPPPPLTTKGATLDARA